MLSGSNLLNLITTRGKIITASVCVMIRVDTGIVYTSTADRKRRKNSPTRTATEYFEYVGLKSHKYTIIGLEYTFTKEY